jgi:hypothetical protein
MSKNGFYFIEHFSFATGRGAHHLVCECCARDLVEAAEVKTPCSKLPKVVVVPLEFVPSFDI